MIRLICIALLCLGAPCAAQTTTDDEASGLRVVGEGRVTASPDVATMRLGVEARAETAEDALSQMRAGMARVLDALRADGIAERDLQTGTFSLSPIYPNSYSPGRTEAPQVAGYVAVSDVVARLRDPARMGAVLDLAMEQGANRLGGLSFELSDPAVQQDAALRDAIADARRKADIMAEAGGIALGPMIGLVEEGAMPPAPRMMEATRMADGAVAAGEVEITVRVTATFAVGN